MPPDNTNEALMTIYKTHSISSSHILNLPYDSKCNQTHGHNYKIEVWITGTMNELGLVVDFNTIKTVVMELDHAHINDFVEPATAEMMADYYCKKLGAVCGNSVRSVKVRVWETDSCYAELEMQLSH